MEIAKTGSNKLLRNNSVGFVLIFNEANRFEEWFCWICLCVKSDNFKQTY